MDTLGILLFEAFLILQRLLSTTCLSGVRTSCKVWWDSRATATRGCPPTSVLQGGNLTAEPHRPPLPLPARCPLQLHFSPYTFTGVTVFTIPEGFSNVASLTWSRERFSFHTWGSTKCYELTDKTVIACSSFHGDSLTQTQVTETRLKMHKPFNIKAIITGAIAAMPSPIPYFRCFFP